MTKQELMEAVAEALNLGIEDIKCIRTNIDGAVLDISGLDIEDTEDEEDDLDDGEEVA